MAAIFPSALSTEDDDNVSFPTSAGGSTNIAEGCAAAGVNNAMRSIAAMIASSWGGMHTSTGTTRPDSTQADQFWVGNTSVATEHHIYWYDGTQNFQIADYDVTNNTFTWTVDTTGTATTASALTSGTNLAASGINVFTSAAQTVTAGSSTTIAHGLGAVPSFIEVIFEANAADANWADGDRVHMANTVMDGNNGHTCWADATNIYFIVGSGGLIAFDKTAFTSAGLTEANWDIYVKAMR